MSLLWSTASCKWAVSAGDRAIEPMAYFGVRDTVWGLGLSIRATRWVMVKRRGSWWCVVMCYDVMFYVMQCCALLRCDVVLSSSVLCCVVMCRVVLQHMTYLLLLLLGCFALGHGVVAECHVAMELKQIEVIMCFLTVF